MVATIILIKLKYCNSSSEDTDTDKENVSRDSNVFNPTSDECYNEDDLSPVLEEEVKNECYDENNFIPVLTVKINKNRKIDECYNEDDLSPVLEKEGIECYEEDDFTYNPTVRKKNWKKANCHNEDDN